MALSTQALRNMVMQSPLYGAVDIDDDGIALIHELLSYLAAKAKNGGVPLLLNLLQAPLATRYGLLFAVLHVANLHFAMIAVAGDLITHIMEDANTHGVAIVTDDHILKLLCNSMVWRVFLPYIRERCGPAS
jgi:hypothetical protein